MTRLTRLDAFCALAPLVFDGQSLSILRAIGHAAIQQGYRVLYREAHTLLEELTDATVAGTRKRYFADVGTVPLPHYR